MVVRQESADRADRLFQALGDATRREIVALTLTGDHSVSELAGRFPMSFAAVQKHVAVLERAGLVTKQRQGREQRVRGNADALREVHRLLDQLTEVWRGRIDRIGEILSDPGPEADPDPGPETDSDPGPETDSDPGPEAEPHPEDGKEHAHDRDRRPEGP
ncbi:metalloregulator ArsR/SmtB family transcription factor [Streptomyces phyllanthi]|uniref:Metalloregulator ArsR/SmtB family transcription factor n=1 Tax=Streptomyces phyllanthi TaxID=1803180 RepID=A0A5N8W6X4_9ACTN|nr:metalloregulator ArsR/SmtB family transcription factor [Streptomyces phyllanthi]MPY43240.1 metalloregulator ArsR/SmtB family transcription factor [Streptomyces phyllanthi]